MANRSREKNGPRERAFTVVAAVAAVIIVATFVFRLAQPDASEGVGLDLVTFGSLVVLFGALAGREFVRKQLVAGAVFAVCTLASLVYTISQAI
ncbi:MAG TPA: hypothetical protein DIW46_06230 [Microbacterium sp.]|uniref:hypothetical protein n=1 Tax=Microbacterium sp. TaxID=51671 RepID=UPI000EBA94E4|nr:hypothetical protein [Microbacterium sp.]